MKSYIFSKWNRLSAVLLLGLMSQGLMGQRSFDPVAPNYESGQLMEPAVRTAEPVLDTPRAAAPPRALPVDENDLAISQPPQAPAPAPRVQQSYRLNDVARFLAGLPSLNEQDSLASWRHSMVWREHAKKLDGLWNQYRLRHEGKVKHWAEICMGNLRNSTTVFYPFSGPDFLFGNLMYPFAQTYVMAGLEPVESLPDFNSLTDEELVQGLKALEVALDSVMQYSYFITKDMKQDFKSSKFGGVVPVFLVFMARSEHVVHGYEAISLNASGSPVKGTFGAKGSNGVSFQLQGNGVQKRVYYFSQNLGNDGFKAGTPFYKFAEKLGRPAGFLKSASYLAHEPYFSNIRDFMLNHCRGIVQDPSGVPYRSLLQKGWNVHLFGGYRETLEVFKKYEQPDLAAAYANPASRAQVVDFSLGYLLDPKTTSIMLAWPSR